MIIFSILGYILLFILIVLLAVIFIPYSYYLEISKNGQVKMGGVISWLFGGLKLLFMATDWKMKSAKVRVLGFQKDIALDNSEDDKKAEANKKGDGKGDLTEDGEADEDEKNAKDKKGKKSMNKGYFKKEVIKKVMETIKKAWRHIRPKTIDANLVAGFEDPMYTGLLCGLFSQTWLLNERYHISFNPSFDKVTLEGHGSIEGHIWLPYILAIALKLILTRPVRKMVFARNK